MFNPDQDGVYARVEASPMRRTSAVTLLFALGGLLLYVALIGGATALFTLGLIGGGGLAIWLGTSLFRATAGGLYLTADALCDAKGRVLAKVDDMQAVERGAFAFKPSHGFVVVLKHKAGRAWAPGLWWRMGRRLGIGGVLPSGQTKFMAEVIATWIALRD